ncbi:MAG: hypothetical protein WCL50_04270 [Spirochaetota bacterium]
MRVIACLGLIALLCISCSTTGRPAATDANASVKFPKVSTSFRVPGGDEVRGFYRFRNGLPQDEASIAPDTGLVDEALSWVDKDQDLRSYLAEAYFRGTVNQDAKRRAKGFFSSKPSLGPEARRILLFLDRAAEGRADATGNTRFRLPDGTYAEDIGLFSFTTVRLFDGELAATAFPGTMYSISVAGSPTPMIAIMSGGGTNALTMDYSAFTGSESEFLRTQASGGSERANYPGAVRWDLSGDGSLAGCNADRILVYRGMKPISDGIESGFVSLYLYSRARNRGFSATWTMNFSTINTFYGDPVRLLDYLATSILLSWIVPPKTSAN